MEAKSDFVYIFTRACKNILKFNREMNIYWAPVTLAPCLLGRCYHPRFKNKEIESHRI